MLLKAIFERFGGHEVNPFDDRSTIVQRFEVHQSMLACGSYLRRPFSIMVHIAATDQTPDVRLDANGVLAIKGCAIPEDAEKFFGPLMATVEKLALGQGASLTVRIALTYFNSSSSKYLLDLLRMIDEAHESGQVNSQVEWYFEPGDLDMKEAGEDYRSLLGMPVVLKQGTMA